MKSIKTTLLTALLTLTLLQGCGFHLRGAVQLPEVMGATWVSGSGVSTDLLDAVKASVRNSNGGIASSASAATAVLALSGEQFSRRVATVGSDGKVSEYQLNYQLDWTLSEKGGEVLREGTLKQRENYQYSANEVLGKSQEEGYLRGVMVRAATRDLMRALRQR